MTEQPPPGRKPPRSKGGSLKGRAYTRHALNTLPGLLSETLRIYRQMKAGTIDIDKGKALVWVLTAARTMVEAQHLQRIERKLDDLDATQKRLPHYRNGHDVEEAETVPL